MNTLRRYETDKAFKAQVKQSLDQLAYPINPQWLQTPQWLYVHSGCEPLPLRTLQEHNQEQIQENKELSSSLRSEPLSRDEEKILLGQAAQALMSIST